MGRPKGSKDKKKQHKWTNEEKEYLAKIVKGKTYKEITQAMNEKFEYQFVESQIKGALNRYKLKTGLNGYFKKGFVPWNKGLKGYMGANKTSFKKGIIPPNYRPVGSERITKDGYLEVKVEDPNKWKLKHRIVYEEHHGEIPKGGNIIFLDGNKKNINIENLKLVSDATLLIANNKKLLFEDRNLSEVGINTANLILKISELKNKK